jgi:hypothetical protein
VAPEICPVNLALRWHTEIGSAVYATPLITDLYSDARKDIIIPGFSNNVLVIEGQDGAKAVGFEGYHGSTLHASPLMHDMDFDGVLDIVVATYDGKIRFIKDNVRRYHRALHTCDPCA